MKNKDVYINLGQTIEQSILKLNKNGEKCLIVIDKNKKLLGTITDGDIRKSLIKGLTIQSSINSIYNKKPVFFYKKNYEQEKIKKIMLSNKYDLVPLVDENHMVIDVINFSDLNNSGLEINKRLKNKTGLVVMAGGQGVRLKPFTNFLPKALLPVKNSTVIGEILNNFFLAGFREANISVNYKSRMLKSYFYENNSILKIKFIKEKVPLGTAGSLFYLKDKYKNILVTNCDVIIKFNILNALIFHEENNYDITILCSAKEYQIPYGVCLTNKKNQLIEIKEKPKFNFFLNIGIYIIKNEIIELIGSKQKKIDFPDLIKIAKKHKKKVSIYPIEENSWFDVGQWNQYNKTLEIIEKNNKE
jgi:dTDP-glucose pyrophosphorylase/predicted transcriptional regulator